MLISSRTNEKIKSALRLRDRSARRERGEFIFEGKKLFDEALSKNVAVKIVFHTSSFKPPLIEGAEIYEVTDGVYAKLSFDSSPDGVMCIASSPSNIITDGKVTGSAFAAVSVRDPGNLGNIIRTAYALGIDTLLLSDCADVLSQKTLRASAGAAFAQNIIICDSGPSLLAILERSGYKPVAAALGDNSIDITEIAKDPLLCPVIGNEGHGLDGSFISSCHGTVKIPMRPESESLNAATAAAILIWEKRKK